MAEAYSSESTRPRTSVPAMTTGRAFGVIGIIYVVLLSAAAIYQGEPPRAVGAGAAVDVFSSGRAMKQLEEISRNPHPLGSAEHARVREFIVQELSSIGLEPEAKATMAVNAKRGDTLLAATVYNVVARLKGSGGGEAVLLAGHYDTVPNSPGASDDGSAVAMLLETVRALKALPSLKNDIIVLFTDGEEVRSLGAGAFIEEHPYVKDVRVVLNFEARGSKGPVIMFETSDQNNWLIEEFAKAAPSPRANSLASEIYRLLPNDTDLTVFKEAGLPGLNFAYIDGFMRYHTHADNYANVSERSLQHQGSYALALARHFGNLDFPKQRGEGEAIYSDVLGLAFINYSAKWVLPLVLLASALFVAVVALGWRGGRLTIAGGLHGVLAFVLTVMAAAIAGFLWWAISSVQHWAGRGLQDDFYQSKFYFMGLSLICAAAAIALYQWFRRKASVEELVAGAQGCCLILLAAASLFLQGGSYLLVWPLVFSCIALGFVFLTRRDESQTTLGRFLVLALCAAPGILLLVPMIYSVFTAVGLGMVWAVAVLVGISLGLLVPHFGLIAGLGRLPVPATAALIGVCLLLWAGLAFDFDRRHPRMNNVFYALNADTGQAIWASTERAADEWTRQFFGDRAERGLITEYVPFYGGAFLKHAAPAVARQPIQVKALEDSSSDGVRALRLSVEPSQPGASVWMSVEPKMEVISTTINGKRVDRPATRTNGQPPSPWALQYWAMPAGGIELKLEVKAQQPVTMRVVERTQGLPQVPGLSVSPRPDNLMPSSFGSSDATLVKKTYTF